MASIPPGQVLAALLQNDRAKLAGLVKQAGVSDLQDLLVRLEAETTKGHANANAVAAIRRLVQNKGGEAGQALSGKKDKRAATAQRQQSIAEVRANEARSPMHNATRVRPPTVAAGDDGGGLVVRLALLALLGAFVSWVWSL